MIVVSQLKDLLHISVKQKSYRDKEYSQQHAYLTYFMAK